MPRTDFVYIRAMIEIPSEEFDRVQDALDWKGKAVLAGDYEFSPIELFALKVIASARVEGE